jgi:hypothetical protein
MQHDEEGQTLLAASKRVHLLKTNKKTRLWGFNKGYGVVVVDILRVSEEKGDGGQ